MLFTVLAASCATRVNYLGTSYKPTTQVDVFVDKASIKKEYDVIGKGFEEERLLNYGNNIEMVQKKAVELAKRKGADAVFFQGYFVANTGAAIHTNSRVDSVGKGTVGISTTLINPTSSSGLTIYFLKYR